MEIIETPGPVPTLKLTTSRGLCKYFFLGLLTFGIYDIVVDSHISEEINYIARRDGRHTMHYCLIFFIFSWLTFGIAALIWNHRISNRMGEELRRRNLPYDFSATDYWLWNIIGSLIIVGPFVYIHKKMKAMNFLCADYNIKG